MFTSSWGILGFNEPITCFRHNIGGKGCKYGKTPAKGTIEEKRKD
jgi:hypothetical protein